MARPVPNGEERTEALLAHENWLDDALAAAFEEHRRTLGERTAKAVLESVKLRRITRGSARHRDNWPEEAWERNGHLMAVSELCLAGILEYLATGLGSRDNVETLARRAFENALDAYWDAGRYAQDFTLLKDIPE